MNQEEKYIGYLKYSGKSVDEGFLDARKSAQALLGFDEILRYFNFKENPEFADINYEIPVKIDKGSWVAYIPLCVALWFGKDYVSAIANKAGSDGFFETGPAKDIVKIFKGSIKAAQWVIKIASHTGTLSNKRLDKTKIIQKNNEVIIEIPDKEGKYLSVPKKYFDKFIDCPNKLFSKNASIIEPNRTLLTFPNYLEY